MAGAPTGSEIRDRIGHPIIDADAHWLEPVPVFLEYLRDTGGADAVDTFRRTYETLDGAWYSATPGERQDRRLKRRAWWSDPWTTKDRATAMLPKLMSERMPELGIDFAMVFPTLGLSAIAYPDADLRRAACRAMNLMTAEAFDGLGERLMPVACIPVMEPGEAIEELDYAVGTLGLRAILFGGSVIRTPLSGGGRPYVDTFGLDSRFDYDPFWQACVDARVAVHDHGGCWTWPDRQSPTNFVFNHVGHFAEGLHASCRAIVLGGVARRFSELPFAFLEGGVGWAAALQLNLQEHWEKRATGFVTKYLSPANLDVVELERLWREYSTYARGGEFDAAASPRSPVTPFVGIQELIEREIEDLDDFAASGIASENDIADVFSSQFFFGAEADDKLTWMAFRSELGLSLKPIFSSDIGHYDVLDMSEVVPSAWRMVETGLIDEDEFRQFMFSNVAKLQTRLDPHFFAGTAVEQAVAAEV